MYLYKQRSGALFHYDTQIAVGYSGFGAAKNDPLSAHVPDLGPIPCGAYLLGGVDEDEHKHGPVAIHLVPLNGNEMYGRSAFLVHGDSVEHPGAASHGCIIMPRSVREPMADGADRLLLVISGNV